MIRHKSNRGLPLMLTLEFRASPRPTFRYYYRKIHKLEMLGSYFLCKPKPLMVFNCAMFV